MADERRGFFGGALRRLKGLFDEVQGGLAEPEEPRFVPPPRPSKSPSHVEAPAPEANDVTAARPVVRLAKVSSRLCLNANILVERVEPIAAYDPSRSHADGHEAPHEDDEEDAEVCERCLAWCPVPGALTIVPESGSVIPKVDAARCTGCGECVSHCAAYPGALTLVTVTTQ